MNWRDRLPLDDYLVQMSREHNLITRYWKNMTEGGAYVGRHDGTAAYAQILIHWLVDRRPTVLQSQREMVDEALSWDETSAGRAAGGLGSLMSKKHDVD